MALVSACCCPITPLAALAPTTQGPPSAPGARCDFLQSCQEPFRGRAICCVEAAGASGPWRNTTGHEGTWPRGRLCAVQGRGSSGIWGAGLGHQEPQAPVPGLLSDLPPSVSRPSNFRGPHAGRGPGSPFWRACTSHPPPNSVWKDFLAKLSAPHWGVKAPEAHFMSPHHRGQEPWLGTCGRGQQSG